MKKQDAAKIEPSSNLQGMVEPDKRFTTCLLEEQRYKQQPGRRGGVRRKSQVALSQALSPLPTTN